MNYKELTRYVVIIGFPLVLAVILGYDVYAIMKGGTEASISSFIIASSYKMPFAVYMVGLINGILVGHLFWRMKTNKDTIEIDKQG